MIEKLFFLPYLWLPVTWIIFGFGAVFGSFLNVCIIRIPQKSFFSPPRSTCPHCSKPIPIWLNIPILSWLLLRGMSQCCKKKISWQYPVVELLTAILTVICYWQHPFVPNDPPYTFWHQTTLLRFGHLLLFTYVLLVCSVIDIRLQIIPNVISLPMIAMSPIVAIIHPDLDLYSSTIGIIAGGGSLYLISWLYYLFRKEIGLGMGDVKLLGAIGGWLGYQAIIPTVFVGSITGSLVGVLLLLMKKGSLKMAVPFGPFLSIGAWIHMISQMHFFF